MLKLIRVTRLSRIIAKLNLRESIKLVTFAVYIIYVVLETVSDDILYYPLSSLPRLCLVLNSKLR
jgi:hypothetical protein